MSDLPDLMIAAAMGLNLVALGTNRLPSLIRVAAVQGVLLGILPLAMDEHWRLTGFALSAATVALKGWVIPWLLRRAIRMAHIDRDLYPAVGLIPSILLGAAGTIAAVVLARRLPLLPQHEDSLLLAGSMASVFTGFLLIIGRSKAISQVCGYLILENGIYLFGLLLLHATPWLVEGGILLDLTVAVFVIGIIMDRIQRTFDSLDMRKLTVLRE